MSPRFDRTSTAAPESATTMLAAMPPALPVRVPRDRIRRRVLLRWGLMGLVGLAGCGGLESVATYETETDPAKLYTNLTFEYRAINLATTPPYNTIRLTATPRNALGEALPGLPAPTFRLKHPEDSTVLRLAPEGQVTALAPGYRITIYAELTAPGPVTYVDTTVINVTADDPPPVLDRFSIDPVSPEVGQFAIITDGIGTLYDFFGLLNPLLTAQAFDPAGQPIAGLVVDYKSLDQTHLLNSYSYAGYYPEWGGRWTGDVVALRPGPVQVEARTWAYGVTKVDTAVYTVTLPKLSFVGSMTDPFSGTGTTGFFPAEVRIVRDGFILFLNQLGEPVDVTFDDPMQVVEPGPIPWCDLVPASCGAGNALLGALEPDDPSSGLFTSTGVRRFPVPGVYTYHSTSAGFTGRIVVSDEVAADMGAP